VGVDRGFLKEGVETFEMEPMSPLNFPNYLSSRLKSMQKILEFLSSAMPNRGSFFLQIFKSMGTFSFEDFFVHHSCR
jgi:hypothetical protein